MHKGIQNSDMKTENHLQLTLTEIIVWRAMNILKTFQRAHCMVFDTVS